MIYSKEGVVQMFMYISSAIVLLKLLQVAFCFAKRTVKCLATPAPKTIKVEITEQEKTDVLTGCKKFDPSKLENEREKIYLWDPATMDYLGETKAMGENEVNAIVARARTAQETWKKSSFD